MKTAKYLVLSVIVFVTACKKNDTPAPVPNTDTTKVDTAGNSFVPDIKLTELIEDLRIGDGWMMSMTTSTSGNVLYMYQEHTSHKGFYIHAYNIATKDLSTVFEYTDATWSNSNGTEGCRIRCYNNKLYISGGASNARVLVLNETDGTLSNAFELPIESPVDMTVTGNDIYCLTVRGYMLRFNLSAVNNNPDTLKYAPGFNAGFNSSVLFVEDNGAGHLALFSGSAPNKLELHGLDNHFEKSVITNVAGGMLVKDSKNRIYFTEADKIVRYSANLTNKEEMLAKGCAEGGTRNTFALKEYPDHIQVFYKDVNKLCSMNIKR